MPAIDSTPASWSERLGWAFDLIDEDPDIRARAHERLKAVGERRSEALAAFNHTWMVAGRWNWTPTVAAASDRYIAACRHVLPDALWENAFADELPAWPGLPYALLYLEWEIRFPDEWMAHGKGWGTKQGKLRKLGQAAARLPMFAIHKLIDLLGLVVQREHRIWDDEYARLARALPADLVRARLDPLAESADFTTRSRAGYLLWLLDNPQLPHPKPSQWRTWLASTIRLPICAACGSSGKPVLYGLPVPEARQAAEMDLLVLAGCFHPDDAPLWQCPSRHQWPGEEPLWRAAIDIALHTAAARPACMNSSGAAR